MISSTLMLPGQFTVRAYSHVDLRQTFYSEHFRTLSRASNKKLTQLISLVSFEQFRLDVLKGLKFQRMP